MINTSIIKKGNNVKIVVSKGQIATGIIIETFKDSFILDIGCHCQPTIKISELTDIILLTILSVDKLLTIREDFIESEMKTDDFLDKLEDKFTGDEINQICDYLDHTCS